MLLLSWVILFNFISCNIITGQLMISNKKLLLLNSEFNNYKLCILTTYILCNENFTYFIFCPIIYILFNENSFIFYN